MGDTKVPKLVWSSVDESRDVSVDEVSIDVYEEIDTNAIKSRTNG